jgi:CelD/BcsL family acetyltransferase involved in cellulose biosynthesis
VATASDTTRRAAATPMGLVVTRLGIDDPAWAAFVAAHPDALGYHTPAWTRMIADTYRFDAFVAATRNTDGVITGGVPVIGISRRGRRRLVSLPFTDTCPPLIAATTSIDAFAAALDRYRRDHGAGSLVVRAPLGTTVPARVVAVTHTLTLGDADQVLARAHPSQVRRNIRRAERDGVTVRVADRRDQLTGTYYALHAATRRRLGTPTQPRRFFDAVWDAVISPGHGQLLLAERGGVTIAGVVLLFGGRTVTYKYGASDDKAWQYRPNHALFAHAIRSACDNGYTAFDWGRSDHADEGLRRFKSSWGAIETPLAYTVLSDTPQATGDGRRGGVAARVIRRSPVWVCRAAGAVFYRYAA